MIPHPGRALADLAQKLALTVAPDTGSSYTAANAGMISMLLIALSQETEQAVNHRLQDGEALRRLFESAGDPETQGARDVFSASQPSSMALTEVTAWLNEGLALLIDLHAWAEDFDPDLNLRIWDFLFQHTERYKIDL